MQQLINSEEFKNNSRNSDKSFVRERKLSFERLVLFFLRGAAKTLSVEINQFFQIYGKEKTECSKQAISKARMKLKHETFIKLNEAAIEEYYQQEYKSYKGYRLLAADGSMIKLPDGEAIQAEYGKINHNENWVNCGWSVVVYDVLNEMIVDAELHKYGRSEREYLLQQLQRMKEGGKQKRDIIIADRGFPSLAMFVNLKQMGYDFVIRYSGEQFLKELKEIVTNEKEEMIIKVSLTCSQQRRKNPELQELVKQGVNTNIRLRVVKIKLSSGEDEYLVTSVLNKKQLSREDLKHIYHLRWSEEEHFKFQKHSVEIENFSGKTGESIRQDYYSRILILNLHSVLVQEAEQQLEEENAKKKQALKYERYKINRNVSYGLVRTRILDLLNEKNADWIKAYDELVAAIKRHKIPVREGRSNPRKKKWSLKYPSNKRRAV